ncbi:unnamed protein product [Diplocarpon coronariae]|nr:hypothetical protein JHW43_000692 [Diplocarpon mali]
MASRLHNKHTTLQANHLTSKVTNRVINKVLLQCNNKCNTLLNNSQSRRGVPVVVDVSVLVSPHCAVAASAKRDARPVPIALWNIFFDHRMDSALSSFPGNINDTKPLSFAQNIRSLAYYNIHTEILVGENTPKSGLEVGDSIHNHSMGWDVEWADAMGDSSDYATFTTSGDWESYSSSVDSATGNRHTNRSLDPVRWGFVANLSQIAARQSAELEDLHGSYHVYEFPFFDYASTAPLPPLGNLNITGQTMHIVESAASGLSIQAGTNPSSIVSSTGHDNYEEETLGYAQPCNASKENRAYQSKSVKFMPAPLQP